jgi:hypothetical protein
MPTEHSQRKARRSNQPRTVRVDIVYACGARASVAGVVAGFAWARPTTTASVLHYTQAGSLSYSAPVPPDSVYGSEGLRTGQPVYTSVVSKLRVGFSYQLQTGAPTALSGSEQLVATIDNGQGITRNFTLQPLTRFSGPLGAQSCGQRLQQGGWGPTGQLYSRHFPQREATGQPRLATAQRDL